MSADPADFSSPQSPSSSPKPQDVAPPAPTAPMATAPEDDASAMHVASSSSPAATHDSTVDNPQPAGAAENGTTSEAATDSGAAGKPSAGPLSGRGGLANRGPLSQRSSIEKRPRMLPDKKPPRTKNRPPRTGAEGTSHAATAEGGAADESFVAAGIDTSTASLPRSGVRVAPPSKREPLSEDLEQALQEVFAGSDIEQLIVEQTVVSEALEVDSRHTGQVVRSDTEHVFLSLGGRNEAAVPLRQFTTPPAVGDSLEVTVKGFNSEDGLYEATVPGATLDVGDWSDLVEGAVVEARVTASNTGGLECQVNNIRGFIPASQVARFRIEDFSEYIDQKLLCVVTEVNPLRRNLVLSHRAYLEREREEQRQQMLASIEVGQTREGVVRSVRDFGAFVDLGGLDGLVHISQLSWDRIKHPSEVVKEGDKIRVRVEKVDAQTGKIGLSYRDLLDHPWTNAAVRFPVGTMVNGVVSRIANFGAFVKLAPGVEGLVHISELAHYRVPNVSAIVNEGQEVQVKILTVDSEAQRISLSMKALHKAPESESVDGDAAPDDETTNEQEAPRRTQPTGPLRGGTDRPTGGEQFGLRW